MSIRESFYQTNSGVDPTTGLVAGGEQFVGLQNYTDIFAGDNPVTGTYGTMDRFWNAFLNTTFLTIVCVLLETVLGVAMALIMAKAFRGRGIVRAGILVPWAIPTIVSALMWKLIFDEAGVMNRILGQQILWLADTGASFWAIVIADVWKTAPFIGLLTLAGLQTIPAEVYEAAKVDGATAWQQFVRITLPMVKPTLVVAVLFRTLDTMRMFDLPYGMIGAGKYRVETLSIFAYQEATQTRYGPAAAYAIVLFIYVLLVAFLFVKILGADVIGDSGMPKKKKKKKAMTTGDSRAGAGAGDDGRVRTDVHHATADVHEDAPDPGRDRAARPPEAEPEGPGRDGRLLRRHGRSSSSTASFPFYWMVVSSLRMPTEGPEHRVHPQPGVARELRGRLLRHTNNFGRSLINSVIVSGTTTVLTLLFGIVAAYALARLTFRGKGGVLWLIMACSMFPLIILIPPLLKMFSSTEPFTWFPYWINTYQAVIIPGLSFGLPLAVWNLTAFFKQLPVELEQAAMVDGCTPGVAFRKVILPLAAPGVFTTAIIVFIGAWNEFLLALTFLQDTNKQTATVAISKFTGTTGFDTPYGTIMAAGVIVTVPLLIAVLIFQRRIVAGLTAGGVK